MQYTSILALVLSALALASTGAALPSGDGALRVRSVAAPSAAKATATAVAKKAPAAAKKTGKGKGSAAADAANSTTTAAANSTTTAAANSTTTAAANSTTTAAANSTTTAVANSTATASSADGTATAAANSTAAAAANSTSTVSGAIARARPCDMGDQSLAGGLQANVLVGIGQQASVTTLQGALAAGDTAGFTAGVTRLQQFMSTSGLQLQMATGIADGGSLAQPQLQSLAASLATQSTMVASLTGAAADNATLATLAQSFQDSTGVSQDGVNNALIDCFIPTNAVSG